jgi:hypothetical protein
MIFWMNDKNWPGFVNSLTPTTFAPRWIILRVRAISGVVCSLSVGTNSFPVFSLSHQREAACQLSHINISNWSSRLYSQWVDRFSIFDFVLAAGPRSSLSPTPATPACSLHLLPANWLHACTSTTPCKRALDCSLPESHGRRALPAG